MQIWKKCKKQANHKKNAQMQKKQITKKKQKKMRPNQSSKNKKQKKREKKGKQNPFAQKGFYPTKSPQAPIWIEKIGPLKLFVVLVPGLLCNFGWEVTIKIHYSTVSGGSLQVKPFYF